MLNLRALLLRGALAGLLSGALSGPAHASELVFSPDRPGVGESTATPGQGHMMVEGGVLATPVGGELFTGTSAVTGRYGAFEFLELRLQVPDVALTPNAGLGSSAVGVKVAGAVNGDLALSAVPSLSFDFNGNLAVNLSANASYALDPVGVWANVSVLDLASAVASAGGGVGYPLGSGGVFAHGAFAFGNNGGYLGPGGWLSLGEAAQLDAGVDITLVGGARFATIYAGGSVGF